MVAYRTDGQVVPGNQALMAQGETDRAICMGEVQKVAAVAAGSANAAAVASQQQVAYVDIFRGCMASRGYNVVLADKARAK